MGWTSPGKTKSFRLPPEGKKGDDAAVGCDDLSRLSLSYDPVTRRTLLMSDISGVAVYVPIKDTISYMWDDDTAVTKKKKKKAHHKTMKKKKKKAT